MQTEKERERGGGREKERKSKPTKKEVYDEREREKSVLCLHGDDSTNVRWGQSMKKRTVNAEGSRKRRRSGDRKVYVCGCVCVWRGQERRGRPLHPHSPPFPPLSLSRQERERGGWNM